MNRKVRSLLPYLALLTAPGTGWAQEEIPAPKEESEVSSPSAETTAAPSPGAAERALPRAAPAAQGEQSGKRDIEDRFDPLLGISGGLTADQAAQSAAGYTQEAIIAQADQASAKAQKKQVVYQYLPRLTLSASYTRQSVPDIGNPFGGDDGGLVVSPSPPGPLGDDPELFVMDGSSMSFLPLKNNWHLNAGLVVPISDYLLNFSQALHGADAATEAAELTEKAARLTAAANARLAYYEWVRTRLRVAEAESSVGRAKAQLEDLRRLLAGGRSARADVLRQDAFVANMELNVRRAKTREAVARENLHVLMSGGNGETPEWEIGENVLEDRDLDKKALSDVTSLQKEALQSRLEIRSLDRTKYALSQQQTVEKTRGYPRLEAFGNLTYANPNMRYIYPTPEWNGSWDVGLRLTWTVNDLGANYAAAEVTETEMAKVEAQKRQIGDSLRTEVLTAHRSIEEARLARESARRGVAAAEAAYIDRSYLFEGGRATTLDVLQAESALITARMDLIDAYIALRQAEVRLEHAVGRDVPQASASGNTQARSSKN